VATEQDTGQRLLITQMQHFVLCQYINIPLHGHRSSTGPNKGRSSW